MGEPRCVLVLGSTGSVGRNTLDVIAALERDAPGAFRVDGLAAGRQGERLAEQARAFGVADVALASGDEAAALEGVERVRIGPDAAERLVRDLATDEHLVVAAIVGVAGLPAALAAIEANATLALANKETLVAGGALVMPAVHDAERGAALLPVDSEHSAIMQGLCAGRHPDDVARIVLTASGGPFRTWSADRMAQATVADALAHPTWDMGPKITVDSASMMNKALEIIEAHWLFDLPADRIEVVVHPQSIVHSFVEFVDGSVLAQLSPPDMRTPIQLALTWPRRRSGPAARMDWSGRHDLTFEPADEGRFPALGLARDVIERGGTAGAVLNAANEAAVAAFLAERIEFGRIVPLVRAAVDAIPVTPVGRLEDVLAADRAGRAFVERELAGASTTAR